MDRLLLKKWIHYLAVAGIMFCCSQQYALAQVDSVDITGDYLIDTVAPVQPPVLEYDDDEYYEDDEEAEVTAEKTYFLPFDSLQLKAEAGQYTLRPTPGSVVSSWKKRDEFWYADLSFAAEEEEEKEYRSSFWMSESFFMILTVIAIAAFAALLVIYLGNTNGGLFRRNRNIMRHEEGDPGIPEDIFAISYEKEIARAEQAQDYRMATRLRFLRLLKEMANQNIIQYLDERTNLDYLVQLHQTAWYDDFFRLTRHFEYTWYGLFEVGADQYARIKNDFENVHRRFY